MRKGKKKAVQMVLWMELVKACITVAEMVSERVLVMVA